MTRHFHQRPHFILFPLACLVLLLSACGSAYSPSTSNASSSTVVPSSTARSQSTARPDTIPTQASTTTACPTAGTVRPAIMTPMTQGQHANILYVYEQGTYPKISKSTIKRYDITTGQKTDILSINNATVIGWTQLSADGQWILFVTQVGGKDALQLVRVDGQLQQTLFCPDPTKHIYGAPIWSPDQKHVLLNLVNGDTGNQPPSPLQIGLLDITSGQFQVVLNQPENVAPIAWFDNTKVLLGDYGVTIGGKAYSPLLLDISKGLPQQANNLHKFVNDYYCGDFTRGTDGTSVLIVQCTEKIQGDVTGPSTLTLQPIAGGATRTILTDKTMGIIGIRPISSTALLLLVKNQNGDTSKNGLWKVNIDGTHLTRLFATTQNSTTEQLGDPGSIWSTVSHDGSMYSLQQDDATNQPVKTTLLFGSLNGGAPTAFASLTEDQGTLNMIGWATM
jgi:hypothetical protein